MSFLFRNRLRNGRKISAFLFVLALFYGVLGVAVGLLITGYMKLTRKW
jgi:hypothetical protein